MAKVTLSDVGLRNLPALERGQRSYWDAKFPTFGVRVSQGGSKTFVVNRGNSLITIGRFPILSLSDARTAAKRLLAEFTLGKTRPQSISYAEAVKQFLADKCKRRRARTVSDYERLLNRLRFTDPVANITHAEVARQLGRHEAPSEYNHLLVALRVFFNWANKRHLRTDNPTVGLSTHARVSRARVLTDTELKAVWRATEELTDFNRIVRLCMLTGQRRGELAALQSSWIDGNTITLPKEITKNGREHTFPIGALARSVLPKRESLLFPARSKPTKPFNGWGKLKDALDKKLGDQVAPWTLHDLRRTYATKMAALDTPIHVTERLLNHVSGGLGGIVAVYNRHTYMPEMRAASERFDEWFSTLIAERSSFVLAHDAP